MGAIGKLGASQVDWNPTRTGIFDPVSGNTYPVGNDVSFGTNHILASSLGQYDYVDGLIALAEMQARERILSYETYLRSKVLAAPTGTVFYVRPDTSHNTTRNGLTYATAWGGWAEVVWGGAGVVGDSTLYVCGSHAYSTSITVGAHGATAGHNAIIRGDYAPDPGSITFTGAVFLNHGQPNTTVAKLKVTGGTATCVYLTAKSGLSFNLNEFIGGSNAFSVDMGTAINGLSFTENIIRGHTGTGISMLASTASLTHQNITYTGNLNRDAAGQGFRLSTESPAWPTTTFSGVTIANNVCINVAQVPLMVRIGDASSTTTLPGIQGSNIAVYGNLIDHCGTVAGASGQHGGYMLQGLDNTCSIYENVVQYTYVTGGGLEVSKCTGTDVYRNISHDIYSGSPTGQYQGGLPIDGDGIFIDTVCASVLCHHNLCYNCAGTGQANSGVGIATYYTTNCSFYENIVKNCVHGLSYGAAGESGNIDQRNLVVGVTNAIWKVGTAVVTHTAKENTFVSCTNTFAGGTSTGTLVTA